LASAFNLYLEITLNHQNPSNNSRRSFLKTTAAVGAASTLGFPAYVRALNLNDKLQVGFVAVGGRAKAHVNAAHKHGLQCIAFAEVDKGRWKDGRKEGWEDAVGYTDWREPLDDRDFDGHPLLHREALELVGARSAEPHRRLRQEQRCGHPDGQPGSRRRRLASRLRIHQGRRGR